MPKIKIDGTEMDFDNGLMLLQACDIAGAEVMDVGHMRPQRCA
jgi:NADH dehydrogenase/NADH:ubiquinone oxidoreductase subunit G